MKTKISNLFVVIALFCLIFNPQNVIIGDAATQSQAECVIEGNSLRVLHKLNENERLPMASTTKILTAIIILDDLDLHEKVTIPKEAEGVEGSSVYLKAGDIYTVEELLYGLMLRSGNDCAEALAIYHSKSVEQFALEMNQKASTLGAENSHFVNPHGLPAKGHYATALDLAIISAYAMKNEVFRKIVSTQYYNRHNWQNKNKMLYEYEGANGIKTGFTLLAGRCLVTSAIQNGMELISVVLNSPQMYERTGELLDKSFSDFHMKKLCDKNRYYNGCRVLRDFFYPVTNDEEQLITYQFTKGVGQESGDFHGQMKIYLENSLIFSQNLYMI